MSLSIVLYLVDVMSAIDCVMKSIIVGFIIILLLLALVFFISLDKYHEEEHENIKKQIRFVSKKSWIFFIALFIDILTPAKSTIYLMLGSSYLSSSNLPSKVSQALELKLDDVIKKLKEDK